MAILVMVCSTSGCLGVGIAPFHPLNIILQTWDGEGEEIAISLLVSLTPVLPDYVIEHTVSESFLTHA